MTEDVLHLPIHCWIASTQKMRAGKAVIWHWVFDMSCVFVSVRESAQKCRKIPLIWLNRCRMSPAQEAFSTLFMGPTILISSGSGWMSAHILMSIRGWNHTSKCLLTIKCFWKPPKLVCIGSQPWQYIAVVITAGPQGLKKCRRSGVVVKRKLMMFKTHYPLLLFFSFPPNQKFPSNFMAVRRVDTEGFFTDSFPEFMQIGAFHTMFLKRPPDTRERSQSTPDPFNSSNHWCFVSWMDIVARLHW